MRVLYHLYRVFQPKYTMGVVGVIMNSSDQVLLVEHVFHPKYAWGLPGGWIDANEDPAHALMRELREELQLEVDVQTLLLANTTERMHLDIAFLCTTDADPVQLSYELLAYRWLDRAMLPDMWPFQQSAVDKAYQLRAQGPQPIDIDAGDAGTASEAKADTDVTDATAKDTTWPA